MADELTIQDGQVVSMDYVLFVDNEIVDASDEGEPLLFIQGQGNIITGLENALYGLVVGDEKSVIVTAEDGYGVVDDEAFVDVPKDQFPGEIPLEIGTELQVRSQDGEVMAATIAIVDDATIRLDFNHPLAGKELHFDVKIVDIRPATEEELEHGHVHEDGCEDDCEECGDDCECGESCNCCEEEEE
jgi:FKBP-type peptidyl-prolyl cis-trans isomerase SlyD